MWYWFQLQIIRVNLCEKLGKVIPATENIMKFMNLLCISKPQKFLPLFHVTLSKVKFFCQIYL